MSVSVCGQNQFRLDMGGKFLECFLCAQKSSLHRDNLEPPFKAFTISEPLENFSFPFP